MTYHKGKSNRYLGITALSGLLVLTAIATGGHATDATLLPNAIQYFMDANGKPLSNGKVFMYTPSTTTAKTTWTTADKTVPQANPILLGISGKPSSPIYGDGSYRQLVKDQFNNTIWDFNTASTGGSGGGGVVPVAVGDGNTVGTILAWPGLLAPSNYFFAYGQAISRTTYSTLLSTVTLATNVICTSGLNVLSGISDTQSIGAGAPVEVSCLPPGTTVTAVATNAVTVSANATVSTAVSATFFPWGNGDGSTTFNMPNLRGRTLFGRNNMGGVASVNMTIGGYGNSPNALGAAGPSDRRTISTANLPAYTPAGVITNGAITSIFTGASGQTGLNNSGGTSAYAGGGFAATQITGTVASTQAASTFAGTAQGGNSELLSIVPPASTINYIIKVLPDAVPSAVATSIIVGTTGVAGGTTNGILYDNGGVLGNVPTVNNGIMVSNGSGVPSFSSVFPNIQFDSLVFRGSTSGTVTLSADAIAGTQTVHVPESSGSIPAWITPQYVGFKCDGTTESGILQGSINALPAAGGIIYIPPGSICNDSAVAVIGSKPNVTILGTGNVNESIIAPSVLNYTGTAARYIDARDSRGLTIDGMLLSYSSVSSFTGRLIDVSSLTPGSTVAALINIRNSRIGPSTARTGTATLIYAGGTVDLTVDNTFLWHGAPALVGQAILNQNVRTTLRNTSFVSSETTPIQECGQSWVLDGVVFEPLVSGQAGAFTNTPALYCSAMSIKGIWAGDVTVAGGIWFNGTWQGLEVTGSQIAGDLGSASGGFNFVGSSGVRIGGGNRFELMNTAINCGVSTANSGVTINGNTFVTVTNPISNPSNCTNLSAEGNSPSTSLFTAGQIPVGQTSADLAPKTLSGAGTLSAAGALSVNVGAGAPITGLLPNANLVNPSTTVNSQTCTLGSSCTVTASATSMTVGTTTVLSGTSGRILQDNAGVLGEYPIGTGVATALSVNTGSAGAFVVNGSALGTPSSGVGTNLTGTAAGLTAGNVTTNANLTGPITSVGNATSVTNNAITYAMMQQAPAFTLVGVAGSSTANLASITAGSQNQIMRVDTGGTSIGWGSINLASSLAVGTSILPVANGGTGLSAFGTGVATALGINVGSAGAFVTNGGALGTPSSGVGTNLTGTASGLTAGNVTTNANLTGAVTSVGNAASLGSFTSANLLTALTDETGSGVAVFGTSPTLSTVDARGVWTTGTSWTLPAITLGGTVGGGGNQINNAVIGTSTPLAGTFTTLIGNTSVSSPIHTASGALTFQSNGSTFAGSISTGQLWYLGGTSLTPSAGTTLTVSQNTGGTPATSTLANMLGQFIAADTTIGLQAIDTFGAQGFIAARYAGGTQASKTALPGSTTMFSFGGQGWDTSAYASGALIDFISSASTWSGSNHGMAMRVRTAVDGSTTLTERLRIAQGLSIGDTTDPGVGGLRATGATIQFTALASDAATTDNTVCVSSTGTILKGSGTLGICLGTSSARFKRDVVSMGAGLAEIARLSPKNFFYKKGFGDDGKREQFGFLAEDVVKVLPKLTGLDKEGKPQSVDMVGMIPVLVKAVQELKTANDNLRIEVLALQAKVGAGGRK